MFSKFRIEAVERRARPAGEVTAKTREHPRSNALVSILVHTPAGSQVDAVLERLRPTSYRPIEVVVVTEDPTISDRIDLPAYVKLLVLSGSPSTAVAYNHAAASARGDYLAILPAHLYPIRPTWLTQMVVSLETDSTIAVGAPTTSFDASGNVRPVLHGGVVLGGRGSAPSFQPHPLCESPQADLPPEWQVDALDAGALLVRRSDFDEVGGFDRDFLCGFELLDLTLSLAQRGNVVVNRHAECRQTDPTALPDDLDEFIGAHNLRAFVEKWGARPTRTRIRQYLLDPKQRRRVAITLPPEELGVAAADHHLGRALGRAFEADGWIVTLVPPEEQALRALPGDIDLVISLTDSCDVRHAPRSSLKAAWVRKWVDRWIEKPWFETFDFVYAASSLAAEAISDRTQVQPLMLPPAIDLSEFIPGTAPPYFRNDYVFVGHNIGSGRLLQDVWDVRSDERALVLGTGWDSVPRFARYWRGELKREHLSNVFRGAKLTLDDTPRALKAYGLINDSALEALASGSLVLTDNESASNEYFDGELPVYRNWREFRAALDRFLTNDEARRELVDSLRSKVVTNHDVTAVPARMLAEAASAVYRPTFAIKVASPSPEAAPRWGDTHFGAGLAAALRARGFRARVDILPDWDDPVRQEVDVVILIRGRKSYVPKRGHINVLWLISHPDEISPLECDAYDLVLVASKRFAAHLQSRTSTPVHFFPQATDGRRFVPGEKAPGLTDRALFVGNSRGVDRPAVSWALEQQVPLTVYGKGWEDVLPDAVLAGEYVPNEELPMLYRSAGVVLNDHWPDMREHGFVSNRIFDVLGSGGVVVSDAVAGIEELFGSTVPVFRDAEELASIASSLLSDGALRQELSEKGSKLVHGHHTFERRAEQLVELLRPLLESHELDLAGSRPDLQGAY